MEKYNNWKLKFYTIWAGQAVSLITSAILQMAIIFYLTEKTGSAMVLSMAMNEEASFSGQHDTYLNIISFILTNI